MRAMSDVARFRHGALLGAFAISVMLALPSCAAAQGRAVGVISDKQRSLPDSAQMAAMAGAVQRTRSPAAFALANRTELALTPEQVGYLEALVPTEADSLRIRVRRMMAAMQPASGKTLAGPMLAIIAWSGPIDEAGIRAAACEQSQVQAEMLIGMARDRHAVGVVLTPAQQAEMDALAAKAMSGALLGKP